MVKIENYFRFFAILLPILAITTVGAILYYSYTITFLGEVRTAHFTVYEFQNLTSPLSIVNLTDKIGKLEVGNNNYTLWIHNDGWCDAEIEPTFTLSTKPQPQSNINLKASFSWSGDGTNRINQTKKKALTITITLDVAPETDITNPQYIFELNLRAREVE